MCRIGSFEALQRVFLSVHVAFSLKLVKMASLVSLKSISVCVRSQLYRKVGNFMVSVSVTYK